MTSQDSLRRAVGKFARLVAKGLRLQVLPEEQDPREFIETLSKAKTTASWPSDNLFYRWLMEKGGFFNGARNPVDIMERMTETCLRIGQNRKDALAPLDYLEQRFGRIAIDIPRTCTQDEHTKQILRAVKEIGEWSATHSKALEDGRISRKELNDIMKEGYEAACQIIACIKQAEEAVDE